MNEILIPVLPCLLGFVRAGCSPGCPCPTDTSKAQEAGRGVSSRNGIPPTPYFLLPKKISTSVIPLFLLTEMAVKARQAGSGAGVSVSACVQGEGGF